MTTEVQVKIEGLKIEYLTNDDTQQVKGGWMRLRGKLRAMKLTEVSGRGDNNAVWTWWTLGLSDADSYYEVSLDSLHDNFDRENAEGTIYYMPVTVDFEGEDSWKMFTLMLQADGENKGAFQRIGISRQTFSRAVIDDILSPKEGEEDLPCEEYRDGNHYIRVI